MNKTLVYGGGIVSLLNLMWFAWGIASGAIVPTNTATWLMWFLLDLTALGTAIAARKPFALPLSYTAGAATILAVHLKMGTWQWTWIETSSAIGVTISAILWQKLSADWGTIACVTAMTIASFPIAVSLWMEPNAGAFWVFANAVVACTMTLIGARPWSIGGSLLATCGMVFNGLIAVLTLR